MRSNNNKINNNILTSQNSFNVRSKNPEYQANQSCRTKIKYGYKRVKPKYKQMSTTSQYIKAIILSNMKNRNLK